MQISRHWRLKAKRYRLEGVRFSNGEVRLNDRPALPVTEPDSLPLQPTAIRVPVKA